MNAALVIRFVRSRLQGKNEKKMQAYVQLKGLVGGGGMMFGSEVKGIQETKGLKNNRRAKQRSARKESLTQIEKAINGHDAIGGPKIFRENLMTRSEPKEKS